MKILVTGSSGTIGTRLCEKLIAKGHEVVGVDWRENNWNPDIDKLTVHIDLRDKELLKKLPKGMDLVVHLAANARVFNLVVDPSQARDNWETLFNTLEYARTTKVKKFIFSSSREVYGNNDQIIHREDEAYVSNCESPYTASKVGGEALVHSYQQCYDMDFVMVRYSNVYGMYDNSDRLIPLFIEKFNKGEDITVFGEDKLLDFTYVDDTVDGTILAIENWEKVKNNTFNIAYGKGVTILEVAELLKKHLNSKSKIILKPNRTGEVVKFVADITKAKGVLGYEPKVQIEEGVKLSIEWYTKNPVKIEYR